MDFDAVAAGLQQAVPFNSHVGLRIVSIDEGAGVVDLPDDERLRNHVGSQHAGALFAAGEAASGAAFVGAFAERLGDITPLAERAEIAYRRLARGSIRATGRFSSDARAVMGELDEQGAVRFPIEVKLTDGDGEVVAEMTVAWHVRRNA